MIYGTAKRLVQTVLRLYHRVEVEGMERVPEVGSLILVGNHVSYLDPFYIGAVLPRKVHYMAKKESFSRPWTCWFLRRVGAFPVNREKPDIRSLKTALNRLKEKNMVGIFPEGGRREEDPMQSLKNGATYLALKEGAPILPVYIEGTDKALPRQGKWIRPARIRIRSGS
ncbi:lysophospholipid acyltransferase family protein [Paludifilum halophilum]|uniref:1-acyl-sn-glycerol-3-phosphate acyltransferase n=1 Tax=Paludifilum halophilum TaxID=1642702 RepID=A0A235B6S2_9BACL|nr:lysophospholipid acyltransferase family protein [Paludifilum halophilum]OYD07932.1 hypothetical protein CHM34_07355 [Paludifilum halophilum]